MAIHCSRLLKRLSRHSTSPPSYNYDTLLFFPRPAIPISSTATFHEDSDIRLHRQGCPPNPASESTDSWPAGCWDYFDAIYCISLAARPDRRRSAEVQFERVGLAERVEFLVTEKHPADAEQGIYESHMTCLRKGIAAGARAIMIFEDDVVFERFDAAVLAGCVDFLATTPAWRCFFFGCLVLGSRRTNNRAVLEVRYRSLAHAYAVERRFARELVAQPWRNMPFDTLLRRTAETAHAAYPAFAFQSDSRSDNSSRPMLDRFRRLCGGLARIQRMNEWFHYNRLAIVGLHLLVIAFLLILVLRT